MRNNDFFIKIDIIVCNILKSKTIKKLIYHYLLK